MKPKSHLFRKGDFFISYPLILPKVFSQRDMQGKMLSAFHQFRIGGVVG